LGIKDCCCIITQEGTIQRPAVKICSLPESALIKSLSRCPIKTLKIGIYGRAFLPWG
jgi:hypothetical protein